MEYGKYVANERGDELPVRASLNSSIEPLTNGEQQDRDRRWCGSQQLQPVKLELPVGLLVVI